MNEEFDFTTGMPSEEMAQYLQLYLDETAEQLDGLVESLLELESHPTDANQLNEAFRLVHSIKGSSAMMGLEGITVLTHQLENHFDRLRSGLQQLDQRAMGLILRSIDFLRECNRRLREGHPLGSAAGLLEELNEMGERPRVESPSPTVALPERAAAALDPSAGMGPRPDSSGAQPAEIATDLARAPEENTSAPLRGYRVTVRFEAGLPLADLKAELVLARLAEIATLGECQPARHEIASIAELLSLQVHLETDRPPAEVRAAAEVDGAVSVEVDEGAMAIAATPFTATPSAEAGPSAAGPTSTAGDTGAAMSSYELPPHEVDAADDGGSETAFPPATAAGAGAIESRSKVVETVRVDIERLDNLMNLAGELVVNKARFVQIARQMGPAFKKSGLAGRARAFGETMRRAIELMKTQAAGDHGGREVDWSEQLHELASEIDAIEEQSKLWEAGRRGFAQINEAVDQLSRVSDSLQRGVLDTRMVPVAPLFKRFKRVVRDISLERGKRVNLEIRGEKTELDKRMIDELADPLVHLVRNAIDHGIEPVDERLRRGKPDVGTLWLEAAHSGNNVFISVRDDGGGIGVDKVRRRIVERGLVPAAEAEGLSESDVIDYIWHAGFSTADTVSDISGRGVGMDIVKTRIAELNGTIDVEHAAGQGTTFTVRLPLTLAIIRSLLFRLRDGMFAVPIENVREIVSITHDQIVTIHGRQTFEVRGEFIPLVDIDDVFRWHSVNYRCEVAEGPKTRRVDVVILHAGDKTTGLKVDELHGGQDIVIKSLAENFIHIRGLSGASILGDGSVCLLLDVGAAIGMATDARRKGQPCSAINN